VINATTTMGDRTDSDFTPAADLASNTRFYWRVRAVNVANSFDHFSAWSPVWSFRTVLAAPESLLVIPNVINPLQPTFDWANATGPGTVTNYTIQISTSPTFSTFIVNGTTTDSIYVMLKNLPAGKTIYWRVRVNGANGPSLWTTGSSFVP
jgi:predicted phage tail protein